MPGAVVCADRAGAPRAPEREGGASPADAGSRTATRGGEAGRIVLLLCGSTRRNGVSARYADELAHRLEGEGARVRRWNAAEHAVADCIGCAACRPPARADGGRGAARPESAPAAPGAASPGAHGGPRAAMSDGPGRGVSVESAGRLPCAIDDDMTGLYALIDAADEVHVVCPVYFAGPPGRFKCVLDRLQPYWEWRIGPCARLDRAAEVRRPVTLHAIGAGGDPFGYDPLVAIVKSAFGSAGFFVREVADRIGWGQPAAEAHKQRFPR